MSYTLIETQILHCQQALYKVQILATNLQRYVVVIHPKQFLGTMMLNFSYWVSSAVGRMLLTIKALYLIRLGKFGQIVS